MIGSDTATRAGVRGGWSTGKYEGYPCRLLNAPARSVRVRQHETGSGSRALSAGN